MIKEVENRAQEKSLKEGSCLWLEEKEKAEKWQRQWLRRLQRVLTQSYPFIHLFIHPKCPAMGQDLADMKDKNQRYTKQSPGFKNLLSIACDQLTEQNQVQNWMQVGKETEVKGFEKLKCLPRPRQQWK